MHQPDCTNPTPKPKIKYRPLALFPLGQDLPLFTTTPDRHRDPWRSIEPPTPEPQYEQLSLFGEVNR